MFNYEVIVPLLGAVLIGVVLGAFFSALLSGRIASPTKVSQTQPIADVQVPETEATLLWQHVINFALEHIQDDRPTDESLRLLIDVMRSSADPAVRASAQQLVSSISYRMHQ